MIKRITNKLTNEKVIFIVLLITFILIIVLGTTYSAYVNSTKAEDSTSYQTGLLNIVRISGPPTIELNHLVPMKNSDGMNTEGYTFVLKNEGNLNAKFDVKLTPTASGNTLNIDYLIISVDDEEAVAFGDLKDNAIKSDITLTPEEELTITVKLWLDWDTPNSEIGKSITVEIGTDGEAIS